MTSRGHKQSDYLFEELMLARSEETGPLSQQSFALDGNMPSLAAIDFSNEWMLSTQLSWDIPGPIPLRIYGAASMFKGIFSDGIRYSTGVCLYAPKDILEVYFPVFESKLYQENYEILGRGVGYERKISFRINLRNIGLLDLPDAAIDQL